LVFRALLHLFKRKASVIISCFPSEAKDLTAGGVRQLEVEAALHRHLAR